MKRAVANKIASVAQSCGLTPEIRLSADIPAEEGVVVAVEILNDKAIYNQVELASGGWRPSRKVMCSSARSVLGKPYSAIRAPCRRRSPR